MRSTGEIGLKITSAQREYCRYTGVSAQLERRGAGSSRPELAWVRRQEQESEQVVSDLHAQPEDSIRP